MNALVSGSLETGELFARNISRKRFGLESKYDLSLS